MRKTLLLCIIFILPIFTFAQTETQNLPNWQTYTSPKDDFSVEIPKEFETNLYTIKDVENNEIYISANYRLIFDDQYYFIFSEVIGSGEREYGTFSINELKTFYENSFSKPDPIKIGNLSGERFAFKDTEDFFHNLIFIKTKIRSYLFHTISTNENNADSKRFFSSIKFRKINETKRVNALSDKRNKIEMPARSEESENNNTIFGEKQINESKPDEKKSTAENQTSALFLFSKPRPSYTDLARKYYIQGDILLRVTFLANGTIGGVSAVKKLPMGLTNNAISAARQIRFRPAMRNGVAYSVTKTIQYSFNIY